MLKGTELASIKFSQSEKTEELFNRKAKYVSDGVSNIIPISIKQAKGSVIEDVEGNIYLDFYAGIGVTTAGHCPEPVIESIKKQSSRLLHSCFMVTMYDSYINLAEKLVAITPGNHEKKAMFVNSGAEAVENAIKIARAATGRQGIVSFESGYHGRTLLTMSLTSKVKPYKYEFGPFAPEIYKVPFPNTYNGILNVSESEAAEEYLKYFERFFISEVDPSDIAAIILEPVQGEGGFNIPPKGYWKGLRKLCDKHGILLIADEVQTGFARTGKMFAVEHFEVVPDIITLAKTIASGMPLSAVVGNKKIMDAIGPGRIGGTFGGNPVACEAALATINYIEENNLTKKSEEIGNLIVEKLKKLQQRYSEIGDVRNLGAMIGIEFVKDPEKKSPNKEVVGKIITECLKNGLIIISAGIYGNVIRFLPPLVLTEDQLKQGISIFEEAVHKILGEK